MEFRLPDIGEGIAEGEIVTWLVKVGDTVKEDQPLFEVMTDKATVEIPSPRNGVISKILAKEGEVIPVESVVLVIDEEGSTSVSPVSQSHKKDSEEKKVDFVLVNDQANSFTEEVNKTKVLATPATRKFARDKGVNISQLKGTGKNGKVTFSLSLYALNIYCR
ncbi:hypothetical protein EON78_00465 [bacterium]|nr:MAG: hypothetical protein EON78_00465 [bacterium]